jgi:hypothetical protein
MTTPELIADEIVNKARTALGYYAGFSNIVTDDTLRAAILAIQDDITRPLYNIIQGYKRDADAYEGALHELKEKNKEYAKTQIGNVNPYLNNIMIINKALKGDYHKTDFTEYCEENLIMEDL